MTNVGKIREITQGTYKQPNPVINWNEWVFLRHNEVVAYWVRNLAARYKFDVEAVEIAAYLHDIAYAWTSKNDPTLDDQSMAKAREILKTVDFPEDRTSFIVDSIIFGHGMHNGQNEDLPIEAKIFSTADALAHFIDSNGTTSDFF